MELEAILAIAMFASAIIALLAGFPVAFTLGGVALLFALLGAQLGVYRINQLIGFAEDIDGLMTNRDLLAVPLFILMGVILERSKVAEDLLQIASRLLGGVRGGLGYAVVLVGALLAASTGIVGATVITMTLIALPTMLNQGYDPKLSTGTIAASGTLGQIIPPSIVLILLASAISNASANASGGVVSVQGLFAGALLPGLILVGFYMAWIAFNAFTKPESCPPIDTSGMPPLTFGDIMSGLGAPLLLIFAVLGSIFSGIAPPSQAAAIGAAGAVLLAGMRLGRERGSRIRIIAAGIISTLILVMISALLDASRPDVCGEITLSLTSTAQSALTAMAWAATAMFFLSLVQALRVINQSAQLKPALKSATQITSMVFVIIIGASLFSHVFGGFSGGELVEELLANAPGGPTGALVLTMIVMFILGFFLDFIEIIYIIVPLVAPALIMAGFDPIWLGVLMALNLQTSFLTPPFGFALFYLRGAAPDEVKTIDIWRGAIPFIGLQLLLIAIVAFWQPLATWLPAVFDTPVQQCVVSVETAT